MTRLLRILFTIPALLPLWALYPLSSVVAWLMGSVIGYRRYVVMDNLRACFPEKSETERAKIAREFYRNFADSIVETVKGLHISDKEMSQRMEFDGIDIVDRLMAEKRNIVVYFSHTFNWEWAPSVTMHSQLQPSPDNHILFGQIYRPLRNKAFDRLMLHIRSRFHSVCIDKSTALRQLVRASRNGSFYVGFMSDQHPSHGDAGVLTTLLGRPTLMISGTEVLARKLNAAAIYWDMEHLSRGHYRITIRQMADNLNEVAEGDLTRQYTQLLEQTIRRDPAIWLWSHNRWKHPIPQQ